MHLPTFLGCCLQGVADVVAAPLTARVAKHVVRSSYRGKPGFLVPRLLPASARRMRLFISNHGAPFGDRTTPPEWIGHRVARRIVVVHIADKAGPHVDFHIVDDELGLKASYVINLRNKPVTLKTNNSGRLTENSKQEVLNVLRAEFAGRAYVAQSLDHTEDQGSTEWWNREVNSGYGAGQLREVIADDRVDLFKTGSKIEFMDWRLNPHQESYLFRVFAPKEGRETPIWAAGHKSFARPQVEDRLHLKFDQDPEKFLRLVGDGHITIKEDGASFYFVSGPKGTRFFAPRHSKKTGERIEYTSRFGELRHLTSKEKTTGMGELLMHRNGKPLKAHEIGGLLNRNEPLPEDVHVEGVVYRIDRVGRRGHSQDSYESQLRLIERFTADHPGLRPPTVIGAKDLPSTRELEGAVGVPSGKSISEGRKLKWRGDTFDWEVEDIELSPGSKGGIQGVVWFRSLESGKRFKMGGGPLGPEQQRRDMMENPDEYIGKVMKVACLNGHEGRAAKFEDWHMDKGTG